MFTQLPCYFTIHKNITLTNGAFYFKIYYHIVLLLPHKFLHLSHSYYRVYEFRKYGIRLSYINTMTFIPSFHRIIKVVQNLKWTHARAPAPALARARARAHTHTHARTHTQR